MSTSGSKNYSISRSDIIESALLKVGDFDAGDVAEETGTTARTLNLMVKAWTARGADLFLRQDVTLFLQPGQKTYSLGLSGDENTNSYVETTLSAAEASGQTTLSLTSTTGMSAGDRIGIKMDDNTIHWTTIGGDPTSTTVLVATATDDDAASGNKVYAYTTKADRPQKILYANRSDTSGIDNSIRIIGENEYRSLSNKSSAGPPNQVWYRPALTSGILHVWPVNGGSTVDKIQLVTQTLADDLDSAANEPEFPIEWGEALVYGLAARLAPEFGIEYKERQILNAEAEIRLNEMLDYDVENADVIFTMGSR